MADVRQLIYLLNNQPNGVRIGCSRYPCRNVMTTPFHHLSRLQQIEQITAMLAHGVELVELQRELYLVAHKTTGAMWLEFGLYDGLSASTESNTSSDSSSDNYDID